ncbi:PREDICTED: uncharacterized protein LOC104809590 isoform X2 [Tarenaya hassleriana]|uniref:uncharacterized protein LOC104809590 isoform X2 n=1 Tax=Tarenaya hassleriana TaxID=28532 RepID=UPI00053C6EA7|nr:PREDICTED: uncharacterized protein LOC104809590 isoform X2 [Tarenaya hassleriana]
MNTEFHAKQRMKPTRQPKPTKTKSFFSPAPALQFPFSLFLGCLDSPEFLGVSGVLSLFPSLNVAAPAEIRVFCREKILSSETRLSFIVAGVKFLVDSSCPFWFLLGFVSESKRVMKSSFFEHGLSFQSDAGNSSAVVIPIESYCPSSTSTIGEVFPGISGMNTTSGFLSAGNYSSSASVSGVLDSVSGLKHEASAVMDWAVGEQYLLEKGLEIYKDDSKIMKYIKIAATLPDKTVRDVALRCRWMQRKRRKGEEHSSAKKISNRKDKPVDSSPTLKLNKLPDMPQQNAAFASFMNSMYHSVRLPCEGLSEMAIDLLQQNKLAFSQISHNISACKLRDNINLFSQARNNISAILNDMREMPGIMSRMPPLPVSINEDLASSILMSTTQSHTPCPRASV